MITIPFLNVAIMCAEHMAIRASHEQLQKNWQQPKNRKKNKQKRKVKNYENRK